MIDFDALVSRDALQNQHQQFDFQFLPHRDRETLKPRVHCLEADMMSNLLDNMVIPVPAEAVNQRVAGYFRKGSQAANTN